MHEASWSRSEALACLESAERRATQDPDLLWRRVGLKPGDTVVDVGSGTGYYTFPAAAMVGAEGRVYAVDVSRELVELVRQRATDRDARNVISVLSTRSRIPIEDGIADMAILANVLHGIPPKTVDETVRILRPGGHLVNVDWKKESTPVGPPVQHRLSPAEARETFTARGLRVVGTFELGPFHYVQVFERPRPRQHPGHLISAE